MLGDTPRGAGVRAIGMTKSLSSESLDSSGEDSETSKQMNMKYNINTMIIL